MKRLRRVGRWFQRQPRVRPFISVLFMLMLVVVPGYFRLENAVHKANESAHQVKILVQRENARDRSLAISNCQTRNTASKNGRDRFDTFFTGIEVVFSASVQTPERQQQVKAFVQSLRSHVPLDAKAEDVDCNRNGMLDPNDYGS